MNGNEGFPAPLAPLNSSLGSRRQVRAIGQSATPGLASVHNNNGLLPCGFSNPAWELSHCNLISVLASLAVFSKHWLGELPFSVCVGNGRGQVMRAGWVENAREDRVQGP